MTQPKQWRGSATALAWLASQSGPPPHEPGTVGHTRYEKLADLDGMP